MKAQKLDSGNYRIRKTIDGKRHSITFDHRPTQKEILEEVTKIMNSSVTSKNAPNRSFKDCALKYLDIKSNILSASTKKGYTSVLNNMDNAFLSLQLKDMSQLVIQRYINQISLHYSPKTVRNVNAFISAVLSTFIPEVKYNIALPKRKKKDIENEYIPTKEDVKQIIDASTEEYKIVFTLATYGLRRSEIIALDVQDIRKDSIKINKAMVVNTDNEWIIQEYNKTYESNRIVPIDPDLKLMERVQKQGYVFKGHPSKIHGYLKRKQKQLNIPEFRFHDFRHYMATELHQAGVSDKDIQSVGGWSSDYTLKRVYEHDRIRNDKKLQNKAAKILGGNLL